ncbi:MAG TPA: hypothetical protein VFA04_06155 [Bryobacteraceae bacterium]|nr:hypothetical protein [Bryobacteraceae bacterium]
MAVETCHGRLAYVAGLRDAAGRYQHHGMGLVYGRENANAAIRKCHLRAFREFTELSLDRTTADVDSSLASQDGDAQAWTDIRAWRDLVPDSVRGRERKLFVAEARLLMARLIQRAAAAGPDRAA